MKINPHYVLRFLDGLPYLLPYGQAVAGHRQGIRLNEAGLRIWKALDTHPQEEELYQVLRSSYEKEGIDCSTLREDLNSFLDKLASLHIINRGNSPSALPFSHSKQNDTQGGDAVRDAHFFSIGGMVLDFQGPLSVFPEEFEAFRCGPVSGSPDLALRIHPGPKTFPETESILLRTPQLMICKGEKHYAILYPAHSAIMECRIASDGSAADFYCKLPFDAALRTCLFHSIRFAFLTAAQQRGLFALHSSSILYQDRAVAFAGPSGMGKSTHTGLWNELYQIPVLNGDLNLIGWEQGRPKVYGLPWCGTSGIFSSKTYPLGALVMLKKNSSDRCRRLSGSEKLLMISHRLVSPSWTREMLDRNLEFSGRLAAALPVLRLSCTKNPSSVRLIKAELDQLFKENGPVC